MNCQRVMKRLSPFLDEMLEGDLALHVSEHLARCSGCRAELDRLSVLRSRLGSLGRVPTPEYLRDLVQIRLLSAQQETWSVRLREAVEYRWSRIKTTEGIWYLTRILGTAMTFFFFFVLPALMNPILLDLRPQIPIGGGLPPQIRQQLGTHLLKNLGILPVEAQRRPISSSEPMINDLYLLDFGQSASRTGADDSFSVVTMVDRSGMAKIQNVLENPADSTLLYRFSSMINSARFRPASQNGRAVDSHLVLAFSKISVYD